MINRKKISYDLDIIMRAAVELKNLPRERESCVIILGKIKYSQVCDVTKGSRKDSCSRDFYRLLGFCVANYAKQVIVLHNHPSPNPNCWASEKDVESANELKERLKEFDIELIDSVVVSEDDMWSIAEHKWEYVEPEYWKEEYKNRRKTKPIY